TPTALLVLSQALWFTVPIIARSEGFGIDTVAFNLVDAQYSFWWIAFAHSVQYLWVTRYFARSGGAGRHYFTRATFAGFAVFGLPVLIFSTTGLTPVPYDAGLFLLVNTAVNLHHFILDGAIWKLRDGAVARVLLRPVEPSKQVDPGSRGLPWRRIAVVVVASLYMVQYVVNAEEKEFGVNRADGASERLRSAERRLARIRLPSPMVSARLGIALANDGKLLEAEAALERSIDQRASALAWTALGQVRARQKDWPGAEEALTQAIALEPDQRSALHELGQVRFTAGDAAGAIAPLERALELSAGEVRRNVALLLKRAQSAAQ
ncbi:MAG: tetratricopeptide repeat protein, partial [Myxococcales bacterium]|nr:tetratricopeptide repeat protein [Myxococcales bacterium]